MLSLHRTRPPTATVIFISYLGRIPRRRPRRACDLLPAERVSAPVCATPAEAESLEPEAKRFLESLLARAGVELACYRGAPLARRLQACLRSLRARSLSEAWERLVREPDQVAQAASTLLIGVTQFFREPAVFSYLDKAVLPKLSASGTGLRVSERRLR